MEGCFELITFLDVDIIASPSNVQLGEPASILKTIHKLWNKGEGILVGDGDFIQLLIVLYWSESPILLLDKEEW